MKSRENDGIVRESIKGGDELEDLDIELVETDAESPSLVSSGSICGVALAIASATGEGGIALEDLTSQTVGSITDRLRGQNFLLDPATVRSLVVAVGRSSTYLSVSDGRVVFDAARFEKATNQ